MSSTSPINSRRRLARSYGVILSFLVVSIGGCNRSGLNLAHVEGVVTLDNQPVEDAAVLFLPDDPAMGPPAAGTTDSEGRFTLLTANQPGAAIGQHKVAISKDTTEIIPQRRGFPIYRTTYTIPQKYSDAASSELAATVKDEENQIDFKLLSQ